MNKILKQILLTAKDLALTSVESTVPGSAIIISGVQKLVDKDDINNSAAIMELADGVITAVNSLKGKELVDGTLVSQGLAEVKGGFDKIKRGIK